jgi:hypothetical protein
MPDVCGVLSLEWPDVEDVDPEEEAWRFLAGRSVTGNPLAQCSIIVCNRSFSTAVHVFCYLFYSLFVDNPVLLAFAECFEQPGTAASAVRLFSLQTVLRKTGLPECQVREARRQVMEDHGVHLMAFTLAAKFVAQPWCVEELVRSRGTLKAQSFSVWSKNSNTLGRLYMALRTTLRVWWTEYGTEVACMPPDELQVRLRRHLNGFVARYEYIVVKDTTTKNTFTDSSITTPITGSKLAEFPASQENL